MKKIFALLLALLMLASVLAGCASEQVNNDTNPETKPDASANTDVNAKPAAEKAPEKSLKIVTTIFPEYDWVREVLGDQAENDELTMLLDNGVDLHSYQPTADDIVKISDCDLFIYVGGESDGWVDDALKNATNKNMKVIDLLEVLGDSVKAEEVVEVCRKQSTITTMTTARKSPPLKTMRFRTEAYLTGRVTGSLPIPSRWTERWMMRSQRWQRKAR